ncbi:hypothetical protein KM043_013735 [Ampulex compressa]|nr:hypothetical protein KM043_013735 [Ampulex compressa]
MPRWAQSSPRPSTSINGGSMTAIDKRKLHLGSRSRRFRGVGSPEIPAAELPFNFEAPSVTQVESRGTEQVPREVNDWREAVVVVVVVVVLLLLVLVAVLLVVEMMAEKGRRFSE